MSRLERPAMLLHMALLLSRRGTCTRLQVGALIVRDARILSMGYNGAPSGVVHCTHPAWSLEPCSRSVHAEANAIAWAARSGLATEGAEIWITHQPCLSCAQLIINAGIEEVNFIHPYRDPAGLGLLEEVDIPHHQWSYDEGKPDIWYP